MQLLQEIQSSSLPIFWNLCLFQVFFFFRLVKIAVLFRIIPQLFFFICYSHLIYLYHHHQPDFNKDHKQVISNSRVKRSDEMSKHHKHYRDRSSSEERSRSPPKHHKKHSYEKQQRWEREQKYEGNSRSLPKFKMEETKTLMLENVCSVQPQIEGTFRDMSISIGTSVPEEIQLKDSNAYIKYPSIEVATEVYNHLQGEISIKSKLFNIQFYPIRKVDAGNIYDWYCNSCDYKNFAKRNKCYRCDNERNANCRLNYSSTVNIKQSKDQHMQNCSLMIRGPIIMEIEQETLLDIFEAMAPVKDIRMIKNKVTGKFKDFAFVQFYSPEETTEAFKITNQPYFKIRGEKVTIMYSRNKSEEDYAKPLPYQSKDRDKRKEQPKKQKKEEFVENYYKRQRQMQIQQEKSRPIITLEQLKQKKQLEMKKNMPANNKQMTEEQSMRRQADILARQWEKQMKMQNMITMYLCVICERKFKNEDEMKNHEINSKLHIFRREKYHQTKQNLEI